MTSTESYWPFLSRISASSVEWHKKAEDSPDLPQMIQLLKSRVEFIISSELGRLFEETWLCRTEEL